MVNRSALESSFNQNKYENKFGNKSKIMKSDMNKSAFNSPNSNQQSFRKPTELGSPGFEFQGLENGNDANNFNRK